MNITTTPALTIRPAYADDQLALLRLAALDSAEAVPVAPLLLAEVDGELRVALSLSDDSAIADPFVPTAEILTLLRHHAHSLRSAPTARLGDRVRTWRRAFSGLQGATAPSR